MTHYVQLLPASAMSPGFQEHIQLDLLALNTVCLSEMLAV